MARVTLAGPLQSAAGGQVEFEVEAADVRELFRQLAATHPALQPVLDKGVTVVIDGEIYRNARFQPIPPGAEVHLLPRMAGG